MPHPNASVAAGTSALAVFIIWLLGRFGVTLTAEDGGAIAGAVATVALFVGRNGIKGVWRKIWGGQEGQSIVELLIVLTFLIAVALLFGKHL